VSRPHATARRLGSSSVAALIAGYEGGATCAQLAEAYGISQTAVKDLLHRQGVQLRRPLGLSAEEINAATDLYEAGWLLREIAAKFGVSQETVRRRLVERGVVTRSGHGDHGERGRSA
jgi:DNA-binding transcriptional regulator LsrR (DeoR family)